MDNKPQALSPLSPSPLRILLLGYGSVAQAFLPLLTSRSSWLQEKLGVYPLISGIGTRRSGFHISSEGVDVEQLAHMQQPLQYFLKNSTPVADAEEFIAAGKAAQASVLLELTALNPQNGQPALQYIQTALQHKMDVITANKGPVAFAQRELQELAQQHNVQFRFESTVMDGLPLINLAQYTLPAVGIRSFRALLNTTSGLVLSMIEQGATHDEAILKAQEMGIAEADPWYDLDGLDAAMKTTILANTLLGAHITPHDVQREGLRTLSPETIRAAARAGTPLRLVSSANRTEDKVIAEVRPQPITSDDILRVGSGTTSVISLETEAMGTITLVEHEPELIQTAYGVLSDLITVLRNRLR